MEENFSTHYSKPKNGYNKQLSKTDRSDHLRSADPNWAADPIPNSPGVSASNLLRSAMAGILPELKLITAAANAAETIFFQFFDSALLVLFCLLEQPTFLRQFSKLVCLEHKT